MKSSVNRLLERTSARDRQRLLAHAQLVELGAGEVLWDRGDRTQHVLFPLDAVVSLFTSLKGAAGLETGLVGSDGLVGSHVALGAGLAPQEASVLVPGQAWRIGVADFVFELNQSASLRRQVNLHIQTVITQLLTTVACVRFHDVASRLARWLLMGDDRTQGSELNVTQETLSRLLGVRRTGVSEAAAALQSAGLITYIRGQLTINNRRGLERAACACRALDRELFNEDC